MPLNAMRVLYVDDQNQTHEDMIEITITDQVALEDWLAFDATGSFYVMARLRKLG